MQRIRQGQTVDSGQAHWFPATRWSLILAAGRDSSTTAQRALESLCEIYWYPVYAYVRAQGQGPEDAQDLTQDFFLRFLRRQLFLVQIGVVQLFPLHGLKILDVLLGLI